MLENVLEKIIQKKSEKIINLRINLLLILKKKLKII
jgi:hypothetical protein